MVHLHSLFHPQAHYGLNYGSFSRSGRAAADAADVAFVESRFKEFILLLSEAFQGNEIFLKGVTSLASVFLPIEKVSQQALLLKTVLLKTAYLLQTQQLVTVKS